MQLAAATHFEKEHSNTIKDFNFKLGDLVLIWHTAIKKALNQKMRPCYQGPTIVILWNRGSTYIIAELDGTLVDQPVATFCVIPYFACTKIPLPPLENLLDVSIDRLHELEHLTEKDTDELFDSDNESVPRMVKKMTEDNQHFSKEEEQTIYSYIFFKNFL